MKYNYEVVYEYTMSKFIYEFMNTYFDENTYLSPHLY